MTCSAVALDSLSDLDCWCFPHESERELHCCWVFVFPRCFEHVCWCFKGVVFFMSTRVPASVLMSVFFVRGALLVNVSVPANYNCRTPVNCVCYIDERFV